jgi:hypothetical protein
MVMTKFSDIDSIINNTLGYGGKQGNICLASSDR